jgi:hypothetical protein
MLAMTHLEDTLDIDPPPHRDHTVAPAEAEVAFRRAYRDQFAARGADSSASSGAASMRPDHPPPSA